MVTSSFLQAVAVVAAPPLWLDVLRSPAVILASIAVLVKWVVAPALSTYTRRELQAELHQIAQFPLFVDRVSRIEKALETLADSSSTTTEALARIEEQVRSLHDERDRVPQHPNHGAPTPAPFPRSTL